MNKQATETQSKAATLVKAEAAAAKHSYTCFAAASGKYCKTCAALLQAAIDAEEAFITRASA